MGSSPHARGASQIFSTGGVAVDAVEKREKGEAALESGHTGEVDVEVSGVFARVCLAFKGGAGPPAKFGRRTRFCSALTLALLITPFELTLSDTNCYHLDKAVSVGRVGARLGGL